MKNLKPLNLIRTILRSESMKKVSYEYLNQIAVCPVCKEKHRQGEMICGKWICKYCYEKMVNKYEQK